ncbi:MAG: hypothetical protein KGL39_09730 [Patescibacteria group bacterium]|nr:hypothetical protein [Patescibacteria group bacterium]
MSSSTLITDYLGRGTHAARPAAPNVPAGGTAAYYETDTGNSFIWSGGAWVQLNSSGGGGVLVPQWVLGDEGEVGEMGPPGAAGAQGPAGSGGGSVTNIVWDLSVGVPALSGFAQINLSGTSSVVENAGKSLQLIDSGRNAENLIGLAYTAPATPYRIALFAQFSANLIGTQAQGLVWGFTDGTKFETFSINPAGAGGTNATNAQYAVWTSSTAISTYTNVITGKYMLPSWNTWLGIRDDGTNIYFEVSADGANYSVLQQQAHGGLTSYPKVFFGIENRTTVPMAASFRCYDPNGLTRTVP